MIGCRFNAAESVSAFEAASGLVVERVGTYKAGGLADVVEEVGALEADGWLELEVKRVGAFEAAGGLVAVGANKAVGGLGMEVRAGAF